jgi:DnaJ-class molecular chaperone
MTELDQYSNEELTAELNRRNTVRGSDSAPSDGCGGSAAAWLKSNGICPDCGGLGGRREDHGCYYDDFPCAKCRGTGRYPR